MTLGASGCHHSEVGRPLGSPGGTSTRGGQAGGGLGVHRSGPRYSEYDTIGHICHINSNPCSQAADVGPRQTTRSLIRSGTTPNATCPARPRRGPQLDTPRRASACRLTEVARATWQARHRADTLGTTIFRRSIGDAVVLHLAPVENRLLRRTRHRGVNEVLRTAPSAPERRTSRATRGVTKQRRGAGHGDSGPVVLTLGTSPRANLSPVEGLDPAQRTATHHILS